MKDFKNFQLEEANFEKFDILVRAGLANKAQLQRLHTILQKMHEKEDVSLSRADRMIVTNLFNKMLDLITTDKTIFQKARQVVKEEVEINESSDELKKLPVVLILKRKAIRLFPNGLKVATYYSDKLKKTFTLPASDLGMMGVNEEINNNKVSVPHKGVISELESIVKNRQNNYVKFKDGRKMFVDAFTASAIMQVYEKANDANKEKISSMVNKDKASFIKIADMVFGFAKK